MPFISLQSAFRKIYGQDQQLPWQLPLSCGIICLRRCGRPPCSWYFIEYVKQNGSGAHFYKATQSPSKLAKAPEREEGEEEGPSTSGQAAAETMEARLRAMEARVTSLEAEVADLKGEMERQRQQRKRKNLRRRRTKTSSAAKSGGPWDGCAGE
ncbi:uncharacterized protein LOC143831185 [Paroedura picta]|uniref:uncharacterized protein LOC143831185 n=1 Tax=Paroedura picta TaxID=143630 RepID=UPI0040567CB8